LAIKEIVATRHLWPYAKLEAASEDTPPRSESARDGAIHDWHLNQFRLGFRLMRLETPLPLTLEEHREMGREIKAASARLREFAALVEGVYGPQNQAAFTFHRIVESMDRLCGDLQAQAAADLPGFNVEGFYTSSPTGH
jgi:hypothetical protein